MLRNSVFPIVITALLLCGTEATRSKNPRTEKGRIIAASWKAALGALSVATNPIGTEAFTTTNQRGAGATMFAGQEIQVSSMGHEATYRVLPYDGTPFVHGKVKPTKLRMVNPNGELEGEEKSMSEILKPDANACPNDLTIKDVTPENPKLNIKGQEVQANEVFKEVQKHIGELSKLFDDNGLIHNPVDAVVKLGALHGGLTLAFDPAAQAAFQTFLEQHQLLEPLHTAAMVGGVPAAIFGGITIGGVSLMGAIMSSGGNPVTACAMFLAGFVVVPIVNFGPAVEELAKSNWAPGFDDFLGGPPKLNARWQEADIYDGLYDYENEGDILDDEILDESEYNAFLRGYIDGFKEKRNRRKQRRYRKKDMYHY